MMWHVFSQAAMGASSLVLHDHGIPRSMWHANFLTSIATFAEYSNRTACPSNGPNWTSIMTKAGSQA
jgi:hypothetical protein